MKILENQAHSLSSKLRNPFGLLVLLCGMLFIIWTLSLESTFTTKSIVTTLKSIRSSFPSSNVDQASSDFAENVIISGGNKNRAFEEQLCARQFYWVSINYTFTKLWRGYIFTAVCLCVCVCPCVCVCVCVSVSEQNSSRTDAPILTRFSLNGCLPYWLGNAEISR